MGTHPRERVRTLAVTTPSNTAIAAPQSTTWTLGVGILERIDVVIPSGHIGLTGLQLLWGGRQVVPYDGAEFLRGNDDEITVELGLWTGLGRVTVRTYNLDDSFEHAHYLRAYLVDLERAEPLVARSVIVGGLEAEAPQEPPSLLTDEEIAGLVAAGYTPEDAMPILEEILANTEAILGALAAGGGSPGEELPPVALVAVPDLVGSTQEAADARLTSAGLLGSYVMFADPSPNGTVLAQGPAAGTEVEGGSSVSVTVSSGPGTPPPPARTAVPNVVGMPRPKAKDRLRAAGFTVAVTFVNRPSGQDDEVIDQQPNAGALRAPGFTVTITVRRRT